GGAREKLLAERIQKTAHQWPRAFTPGRRRKQDWNCAAGRKGPVASSLVPSKQRCQRQASQPRSAETSRGSSSATTSAT
ncbi:unnamed protein product, partial [Ixodes pacificus]